jgi:excisionase family DNA binding protein
MDEPEILRINDVCDWLKVSTSTIYRLVRARKLPAFRWGRDYRFRRHDVEAWIVSQQRTAKTATYHRGRQ